MRSSRLVLVFAIAVPVVLWGLAVTPVHAGASVEVSTDSVAAVSPAGGTTAPAVANERPLAEAGLDREVVQGVAVVLDGGGSRDPDGEVVSYAWTITAPDGTVLTPACPDCERTRFTPTQVGRYEVQVTIEDDDGATASDTLYVDVAAAEPPSVNVTGPTTVTTDDTPRYTASVSPGDLPVSRLVWLVDDRVVADRTTADLDGDTLRLTPDSPGTTRLTATVVDTAGNEATDTLRVQVSTPPGNGSATPPVARIDPNRTTVDFGGAVAFSGLRSADTDDVGPQPAIQEYLWDLDGDGVYEITGETVSGRYDAQTTVRLVVTDNDGQESDPATVTVNVGSTPAVSPTAEFRLDRTTPCPDTAVEGDPSLSTGGGPADSDERSAITTTTWRVDGRMVATNDGTPTETLLLSEPGEREVTLTVRDAAGRTDSVTESVTVLAPGEGSCDPDRAPKAVIEYPGNGTVEQGETLSFDGSESYDRDNTATDGSDIVEYEWRVDGDPVHTGVEHTRTFEQGQTVRLTVVDDEGSTDTTSVTVATANSNASDDDGTASDASIDRVYVVGPNRVTGEHYDSAEWHGEYYTACLPSDTPESTYDSASSSSDADCMPPTVLEDVDSVTWTWEYDDGNTRMRTASAGELLQFSVDGDPNKVYQGTRQVKVTVSSQHVNGGQIAGVHYVELCYDPGTNSQQSEYIEASSGHCQGVVSEKVPPIEVTAVTGPSDVGADARATYEATLDNQDLWDSVEMTWEAVGTAAWVDNTGGGQSFTFGFSNEENYSTEVAVKAIAEATRSESGTFDTKTSTGEEKTSVEVCPDDTQPGANGECPDNLEKDDETTDDDPADDGSDNLRCDGQEGCRDRTDDGGDDEFDNGGGGGDDDTSDSDDDTNDGSNGNGSSTGPDNDTYTQ